MFCLKLNLSTVVNDQPGGFPSTRTGRNMMTLWTKLKTYLDDHTYEIAGSMTEAHRLYR